MPLALHCNKMISGSSVVADWCIVHVLCERGEKQALCVSQKSLSALVYSFKSLVFNFSKLNNLNEVSTFPIQTPPIYNSH